MHYFKKCISLWVYTFLWRIYWYHFLWLLSLIIFCNMFFAFFSMVFRPIGFLCARGLVFFFEKTSKLGESDFSMPSYHQPGLKKRKKEKLRKSEQLNTCFVWGNETGEQLLGCSLFMEIYSPQARNLDF